MKDQIVLTGIHGFGYHGVFDHERKDGQDFFVMLKVHRDGKGLCGVYPKDIASTKVELVLTHARKAGHPLQCVMEEA